jgi:LmbE family N-acetylglucosaminyl deacetylase
MCFSRTLFRDGLLPACRQNVCATFLVSTLLAIPFAAFAQYNWEPPTNKIVVLAVNAHPDDEGIFFGGALPYYSAALHLPTMMLSMTSGDWTPSNLTVREAELNCAAWTYGVRYEPLFPRFRDVPSHSLASNPYTNKIDATWDYWADGVLQGDGSDVEAGKLKAINYVAEQIRRYRPEVIITHDVNGEYGHDNHRATAFAVTNAFFVAADPAATATNLAGLPPWQAKKLYLHLYGTNRFFHRFFEERLSSLGNRSCRQVTDAGLDCHVSQSRPDVSTVYRTGENFDNYHSEWWGLYASTVGPDSVLTNDLALNGYTVPAGWSAGNFLENLGITNSANDPPHFIADPIVLSPALKSAVYSGQTLAAWASDPDLAWGETLIFEKISGPAWLTVATNGNLGGTPAQSDLGTNQFVIRVTDGAGLHAQATLVIAVREGFPAVLDLAGWWPLDESSGNLISDFAIPANDGALIGPANLNQPGATAATGTSIFFDGTTSKVDVAYAPELNSTGFTAMVWAKVIGGAGTYRSPLTSRESVPQAGYIFYAGNNNNWQFWLGTGSAWRTLTGGPVVTNLWTHLAGSYDGTTARFYTNGVLAASFATAFRPNQKFPLRIGSGGSESPGQYWFPGFVDDVRVYQAVVTADQIAAVYSNQPPAFHEDPIPVQSVFAGTWLQGQSLAGKATDPAGALLSYGKLSGPTWLTVATDGSLSGMPLTANTGQNSFNIGVSDPHGAMDFATLTIDVLPGRAPGFAEIFQLNPGLIQLTVTGALGQTYFIEASTNLAPGSWLPVATNYTGTNWFRWIESQTTESPHRYYRALIP